MRTRKQSASSTKQSRTPAIKKVIRIIEVALVAAFFVLIKCAMLYFWVRGIMSLGSTPKNRKSERTV